MAQGYTYNPSFSTYAMKQNVVDGGLKLNFLGPDAKFGRSWRRAAYSKSFINYDSSIISSLQQMGLSTPRLIIMFSRSSDMSRPIDIRMSKSISIGAIGNTTPCFRPGKTRILITRVLQSRYSPTVLRCGIPYYGSGYGVYDESSA